jgi:hypothetical protein
MTHDAGFIRVPVKTAYEEDRQKVWYGECKCSGTVPIMFESVSDGALVCIRKVASCGIQCNSCEAYRGDWLRCMNTDNECEGSEVWIEASEAPGAYG